MNAAIAQRAMKDLGLYSGAIDGVWGPLSRAAWEGLVAGFGRCHLPSPSRLMPDGWVWAQAEGALYRDGKPVARGYSGRRPGRNRPDHEAIPTQGPIPAGRWSIGKPRTSARTGPHVIDLTPLGHAAHGRNGFQIHGDNARGDASSGCIILPRAAREMISQSGLAVLEVIP
jgi:hypothetical protein